MNNFKAAIWKSLLPFLRQLELQMRPAGNKRNAFCPLLRDRVFEVTFEDAATVRNDRKEHSAFIEQRMNTAAIAGRVFEMFNDIKGNSEIETSVPRLVLKFLDWLSKNLRRTTNRAPIVRLVITLDHSRVQIDGSNAKTKTSKFVRIAQRAGAKVQGAGRLKRVSDLF